MGKPTRVTNQIRRLRFASGEMTQADLADRIGVTRQTIIAIEQGRYSPSLEMAFQIAQVFNVPLDEVFQYQHRRSRPMTSQTPATPPGHPSAPLVIRIFWSVHRAIYALTRGRLGLRPPTPKQWGMMRLKTLGRRSGRERHAILGYFEDGPNLVTMAMNGWGEPEPAWWLNLQADPDTTVELADGRAPSTVARRPPRSDPGCGRAGRSTTARRALESWAARRSRETAVVILDPRIEPMRPA